MPGVYISYPFCPHKCSFCNFASGVFPVPLEADYLTALLAELRAHAWQWTPDTVYLGGGTPSRMDPGSLERVLSLVPGRPWREATIEAVPGSFSSAQAVRWSELGINRVSLGVQSFVGREIEHTGRRHTAETVQRDCELLRSHGISNISLDLIAGLPGQTPQSWHESLDWVERLAPKHISVYLLEVDEDSRLGAEVLRGGTRFGASAVPDEDTMAGLYELAVPRLQAMGFTRYEISNFAQPGFESLHNLKYWTLAPYAGFGLDAHSFDGEARSANADQMDSYLRAAGRHAMPCDRVQERFFIGLRLTAGIEPTASEWNRYAAPIERFVREGLLERAGSRLRLSSEGVLISNEILEEFVGA